MFAEVTEENLLGGAFLTPNPHTLNMVKHCEDTKPL